MNTERLLKLAEVLENFEEERKNLVVPLDRFDMSEWFRHEGVEGGNECGTAACAMGIAMAHPWFRERGLTEHSYSGHKLTDEPAPGEVHLFTPRVKGDPSVDADERFFDIGHDAAWWLFIEYEGYKDVTPTDVAKRIREYVATGEVPERSGAAL